MMRLLVSGDIQRVPLWAQREREGFDVGGDAKCGVDTGDSVSSGGDGAGGGVSSGDVLPMTTEPGQNEAPDAAETVDVVALSCTAEAAPSCEQRTTALFYCRLQLTPRRPHDEPRDAPCNPVAVSLTVLTIVSSSGPPPATYAQEPDPPVEMVPPVDAADGNARATTSADELVCHLAAESLISESQTTALTELKREVAEAERLSDSQRRAISAAMERRLTLVQGPPGTGKTTTSVRILKGWAALQLRPALCTAECNVAVDNIALGLAKAGVRVVRVGRVRCATSPYAPHTSCARRDSSSSIFSSACRDSHAAYPPHHHLTSSTIT
jgi:regulator of nonsense transcripts 1